ncbi:MAG TPA: hypothetical protein VN154_01960 [Rhizomicrobium sp.]|nr:hypothetical protein [Rhizomicrobium sp.]
MAIDGAYRLILNYPSGRQKITLNLATDGAKVTGTIGGGGLEPAELENGKVEGGCVTFDVTRTIFPFSCTLTVDGDAIGGDADFGKIFDRAWMRGSRVDPATGKSSIDDEPAIAWKDLGLERHELGSPEWVRLLGEWFHSKFDGHDLDFEFRCSTEYSDPPRHLLRDDGRSTIGWHFIVKDGKFEFGDGGLDGEVDFGGTPVPWAVSAVRMRLNTDQLVEANLRERAARAGPATAPPPVHKSEEWQFKFRRLQDFTAGPDNIIREEFLSQRTR